MLNYLIYDIIFSRIFQVLFKIGGIILAVTGIIAEFNPLHNGHKLLIDAAKQDSNTVACVISGNFVQRGDTAVISKIKRAQAALMCGVDIVAELPVLWSMSTAQNFAVGAVSQLYALGCDEIIFGSECGDIEKLINAADILLSDKFAFEVSKAVKEGCTFALARQNAAVSLGAYEDVFKLPNDNLAVEYILAAKKLRLPLSFRCIKREGAGHDSKVSSGCFVSSSLIREKLIGGDIAYAERFMPIQMRGFITPEMISDIKRIETAVLAVLRLKTPEDFKNLPDISEGIENKLYFSVRVASGLDELYNMIKSKRYTLARVRRLVLSAALGLNGSVFMTQPPYVRVLGFSPLGEAHLRQHKSFTPIITRAAAIKQLDDPAKLVFDCECKATDLYSLSLRNPQECGYEYKYKLLKTECM